MSAAYAAGFFDGEGSICSSTQNRKYAQLMVAITNTDKRIIEDWTAKFGGNFYTNNYSSVSNRKPRHQWQTNKKATAVKVLRVLLPYLRVKKQQALLALEFLETVSEEHGGGTGERMPKETVKIRNRICKKLQRLNGRGNRRLYAANVVSGI